MPRRSRLARRDLVGLAALVVALAVGALFLVPGTGSGGKSEIVHGEIIPTATPTVVPTVTPTPVPVTRLGQPRSWYVRYFTGLDPATGRLEAETFLSALDLAFRNAPLNDMQDDNWSVTADADVVLEAGKNTFTVEYQGKVRVLRDQIEVASGTSQGVPKTLDVSLEADASTKVNLEIQGIDVGGPFSLSWK